MAITATIALTPSSVAAGASEPVTATLTISNSGTDDVIVRSVIPISEPNGSTKGSVPIGMGMPAIGPNQRLIVPAAGSLVMTWGLVVHGPQAAGTVYYDIGAEVLTSDGSITRPTVATLTATEPTH
jgi:hypothetical protein